MSSTPTAPAVTDPTWYGRIRDMFSATDRSHMGPQGLDLASYSDVVDHAGDIYQQVAIGNMPPGTPWPADWVGSFHQWMSNSFPKGAPPTGAAPGLQPAAVPGAATVAVTPQATRIRKDINTLSAPELDLLKQAFAAIMAADPGDPNSYFVQAGYHWLPAPSTYCVHHVPGYNPWHRAYLLSFENALRTVPGCAAVTLPYWDITTPFPEALKSPPFDRYTLPQAVGAGYPQGYTTQRFADDEIAANLLQYTVVEDVRRAMGKTDWEDFHGLWSGAAHNTIIAAHDAGHNSIGPTMQDQGVAAFDPVFWFFHCNWDRLFWEWQQGMGATTLGGLLTTINAKTDPLSYQLFTDPVLQALNPFTTSPPSLNTVATIDSATSLDVDYAAAPAAVGVAFVAKTRHAVPANQSFAIDAGRVNVRVGGINRLKIPGSFSVHLQKDGQTIASKAMFQPVEVQQCPNCVANAIVHFDFELPLAAVQDGQLSVWVEPVDKSFVGARFPQKLMGNPTVDVRLLLATE